MLGYVEFSFNFNVLKVSFIFVDILTLLF